MYQNAGCSDMLYSCYRMHALIAEPSQKQEGKGLFRKRTSKEHSGCDLKISSYLRCVRTEPLKLLFPFRDLLALFLPFQKPEALTYMFFRQFILLIQ